MPYTQGLVFATNPLTGGAGRPYQFVLNAMDELPKVDKPCQRHPCDRQRQPFVGAPLPALRLEPLVWLRCTCINPVDLLGGLRQVFNSTSTLMLFCMVILVDSAQRTKPRKLRASIFRQIPEGAVFCSGSR